MTLDKYIVDLLEKGLARKQHIKLDQVNNLLARALKGLESAKINLDIDEEVTYTFAYLSMLRTGRALIYLSGLRPTNKAQHKTVIDFAEFRLGEEYKILIGRFDDMRKTRNKFTYDPGLPISRGEAKDALNTATQFVNKVISFMKKANPQLEFQF